MFGFLGKRSAKYIAIHLFDIPRVCSSCPSDNAKSKRREPVLAYSSPSAPTHNGEYKT